MKKLNRDGKLTLTRETLTVLQPGTLEQVAGGAPQANAAAGNSLIKVCILGSAVRVCAF
jgi:hypothetical protein